MEYKKDKKFYSFDDVIKSIKLIREDQILDLSSNEDQEYINSLQWFLYQKK